MLQLDMIFFAALLYIFIVWKKDLIRKDNKFLYNIITKIRIFDGRNSNFRQSELCEKDDYELVYQPIK